MPSSGGRQMASSGGSGSQGRRPLTFFHYYGVRAIKAASHRCASKLWWATDFTHQNSLPVGKKLENPELWWVIFVARHNYSPTTGERALGLATAFFQN